MFGLGTIKVNPKDPMKKGEKYRLIFDYGGELTQKKIDEIVKAVKKQIKDHLQITRITFNDPSINKLTVEGIAQHDPLPLILIAGLILGIACLWGIKLALKEVYQIVSIFTPNKIMLIIILLGIPYLIFSGRLQVKGLRIKGVK